MVRQRGFCLKFVNPEEEERVKMVAVVLETRMWL